VLIISSIRVSQTVKIRWSINGENGMEFLFCAIFLCFFRMILLLLRFILGFIFGLF